MLRERDTSDGDGREGFEVQEAPAVSPTVPMTPVVAETEHDSDASWQQDALRQADEQEGQELQEMQEAAEVFEQEQRDEELCAQSEAGPPFEPPNSPEPERTLLLE
eukprot:6219467-Alexandrium_andersonii.AAC.1